MNKALPLLLILLLSVVSGAEINAPKEIPSNLNWSFSVELNSSDSFTETEIYFDNLLIVTAFNDKQPVIQEDFVLKAFLFDKKPEDNSGLTVFISYFGIEEGTHKIKTKTFNQGNLIEEKEFELESVDTISALNEIPESIPREEIDLLMKTMIDKINKDKEELEALKNSTEQNVQEKVSVLEQEINSLEEALNELKEVEEEQKQIQETEKEKKDESQVVEEEKDTALTGFYNFSVDNAWMGAVFLIVLLVLMALFQIYRRKSNQTVFEDVLEDKDLDKEFKGETSLQGIDESKEKTSGKRFSIRDLLKK